MKIKSQIVTTYLQDDKRIKGDEFYKPFGNLISNSEIKECFAAFKGLRYYWDCLEKAKYTSRILSNEERGKLYVIIGSLFVKSSDGKSVFGYAFNPPLEFHAFCYSKKQRAVYDLSLPGVIEKGLISYDDYGPCLVKVKPIIIASEIRPSNVNYTFGEYYENKSGNYTRT